MGAEKTRAGCCQSFRLLGVGHRMFGYWSGAQRLDIFFQHPDNVRACPIWFYCTAIGLASPATTDSNSCQVELRMNSSLLQTSPRDLPAPPEGSTLTTWNPSRRASKQCDSLSARRPESRVARVCCVRTNFPFPLFFRLHCSNPCSVEPGVCSVDRFVHFTSNIVSRRRLA